MHGWERITSACGVGCKVFWTPWSQEEKYDSVNKDDNDVTDSQEPVTSEPQKPVWTDLKIGAPIVRNKSGSVGNLKTGLGYEKLSGNTAPIVRHSASLAVLNEKGNSKSDLPGTVPKVEKALLNGSRDLNASRKSLADEILHVQEMVTTV